MNVFTPVLIFSCKFSPTNEVCEKKVAKKKRKKISELKILPVLVLYNKV